MDTDSKKLNQPLVSVVMLTYNRAEYLSQAITSVLSQSYQNWQLFVIDDGSTDETPLLIKGYTDPRINYIHHQNNAGLFVRRNESLSLAQGKYLAVLDSDDLWPDTEKLAKQVDFLETHQDHVLVGTFTTLIDGKGTKIGLDKFATDDSNVRQKIMLRNQFTHSAILIRNSIVKQTNGYQNILAEDLELFMQLGKFGKMANLPIFATSHRIHTDSANDRGIKMATAVHQIIKAHKLSYPNFLKAYSKSLLRLTLAKLRKFIKKS